MQRLCCRYTLPLSELGGDFYDELKSVSSGYASFDYEEAEYRCPPFTLDVAAALLLFCMPVVTPLSAANHVHG